MDVSPSYYRYETPRSCSKCKVKDAVPAGDPRLWCALCREKERGQHKYYRTGNDPTAVKPQKRKQQPPMVEYQTADELYKALRAILRNATSTSVHSTPSFRGCFSIVSNPSVNHKELARDVAKRLMKKTKYPMSAFSRDPSSTSTVARITAVCQCLTLVDVTESTSTSNTSRPLVAKSTSGATSAAPLKAASHHVNSVASSSRTDVANENGNGNKLVEALEASFERNCGGKIKIIVQSDLSHPLGISGQKVTVKILH